MSFLVSMVDPPETILSIQEAMQRWSQDSQGMHLAYKTVGGSWSVLVHVKEGNDDRVYGFAYVSRLLTGRHTYPQDLVFSAPKPKEALCKALKDGRQVRLFTTMYDFVCAMHKHYKKKENCGGC